MIGLSYDEEKATLIVYVRDKSKVTKYVYHPVPLAIYRKCAALINKKVVGKFWQTIKPYQVIEKETYLIKAESILKLLGDSDEQGR